jgi:hypothetical protein
MPSPKRMHRNRGDRHTGLCHLAIHGQPMPTAQRSGGISPASARATCSRRRRPVPPAAVPCVRVSYAATSGALQTTKDRRGAIVVTTPDDQKRPAS